MRVAARAPNHLGDGVMALPALLGLARLGALTIHAPPWGPDLYRAVPARVVPRGAMDADVAVLFAPSLRAAWEARRCPVRIGTPTDHRRALLTHPVQAGGHRRHMYRRLAEAAGATVTGVPSFSATTGSDLPHGHIGLNPVSPSGRVVEWPGFATLASRLEDPVVFYGGPGEDARVAAIASRHPRRVGLSLPAFAAALTRCAVFVSNDSGAAHFARACGVPTVVVHGSTVAERTGPAGAIAVDGPDLPCRPCYAKRCWHEVGCLAVPVHAVTDAIARALK